MTTISSKQADAAARSRPNGGGVPLASSVPLLQSAVAAHQAGRLDEAEAAYRQILEALPNEANALHLLGVLLHQRGDSAAGADLIRNAIAVDPTAAQFHGNLGRILRAMGHLDEAEATLRRAAKMSPKDPAVREHLGVLLEQQGKTEEAIDQLSTVVHLVPEAWPIHKRIGNIYLEHDDHEPAIEHYARFLVHDPDDGEVNSNIGFCYEKLGRLAEAAPHFRKAAEALPDHPQILSNLGQCLARLGEADEAEPVLRRAMELDADNWHIRANHALALHAIGQNARAIRILSEIADQHPEEPQVAVQLAKTYANTGDFDRAQQIVAGILKDQPDHIEALNILAGAHIANQSYPDAEKVYLRILEIDPGYVPSAINLCMAYKYMRRMDEANLHARLAIASPDYTDDLLCIPLTVFNMTCDYEAIEQLGDIWAHAATVEPAVLSSVYLDLLSEAADRDKTEKLFQLHRTWGIDAEKRAASDPLPPPSPRTPDGKIRLGLLSSDFRSHSVANFIMPVLKSYDRDRFELYCYTNREDLTDKVQDRIKTLVDKFVVFRHFVGRDFAERIRADGVDILIEMNGHTKDSMLTTLAWRAAPVQVEYLGYPFTTGLQDTDYFLVDPYMKPENLSLLTEKPLEMRASWVCFGELLDEPIEEPPCLRNGFVTFGTLNNSYKYTKAAIRLWSQALKAVPDSRFLFVRPEGRSLMLVQNLTAAFAAEGIGAERLFFASNRDQNFSHLSYYNEIDVSMDTFPVTGGTTTCEALWMGVPVITLVGESMHERLSYSIISNAGCPEFCVRTQEEYVERAVALAKDPEKLTHYRQVIRPAMKQSTLCRTDRFVEDFQAAMTKVATDRGLA